MLIVSIRFVIFARLTYNLRCNLFFGVLVVVNNYCDKFKLINKCKKSFLLVMLLYVFVYVTGCVGHYKNIPDVDRSPLNNNISKNVKVGIKKLPIVVSSGKKAIEDAFNESKLFDNLEVYFEDDIPKEGIFIHVETKYKAPDLPAIVFGYVSVSTATILPAWSNNDGFDIYYRIYINGNLEKTFRYEKRRFAASWIFLLPFVWVNLFTTGEYDAFYTSTYDFLKSAQPILLKYL